MIMRSLTVVTLALGLSATVEQVNGFTLTSCKGTKVSKLCLAAEENVSAPDDKAKEDALKAAIDAMCGGKPLTESPDVNQQRTRKMIEGNKVVLFMKGTKFFPQCGFSNTATKILEAVNVECEAVDVLSDDSIRQGIKEHSQKWPTIPQLCINQEFIGGLDIMISMFESGELKEVLEES